MDTGEFLGGQLKKEKKKEWEKKTNFIIDRYHDLLLVFILYHNIKLV
jgi:hypothetical protein